ncbi:MAG: TIGR04086 family membrane protein [Christensenellales bacterium]
MYKEKIDISTAGIYRTSFIIGAIIFFIYGLLTGITEKKKGFLSSFISTFIIIAIIIIVKLLSKQSFQPTNLIKYGVYLLTSVVGGILGVNLTSKVRKM